MAKKKRGNADSEVYRKGKIMSFNCPEDLVELLGGQENRSAFIADAIRAHEGRDVGKELRAIAKRLRAIEGRLERIEDAVQEGD